MFKHAELFAIAGLVVGGLIIWQANKPADDGVYVGPSSSALTELDSPSPSPTPTHIASPVPTIRVTPSPKPSVSGTEGLIHHTVAFAAQAPLGEWSDPWQQDGCEEASAIMAMYWVRGIPSITPEKAKQEILSVVAWEEEHYNNSRDTSAQDTADRIIEGYFGHANVQVTGNVSIDSIVDVLRDGKLVIVPVNGRLLGNPYYTAPVQSGINSLSSAMIP